MDVWYVALVCTHVDDILVARNKSLTLEDVMGSCYHRFEWKWTMKQFTFRGREISEDVDGARVRTKQYAMSLKTIKIDKERRKELA